ncbi:MAG: HEAT repeat domain-containing protein [candidate division NC10 bacterium]|nr:HEAT repeat domain-containing protein [candidate division NC10 bacterium]
MTGCGVEGLAPTFMPMGAVPLTHEVWLQSHSGQMKNDWVRSAAWAIVCLIFAGLTGCASTPELQRRQRPVQKAINVEALSPVVRDTTRSDRVRMKAARALAASTDPKALDPIFSVIQDRQTRPTLRAAMVHVVGRSSQQKAVAAFLVERLADEQEAAEVRFAAAASLGSMKDASQESLAQLRRAGGDADPTVRLAARWALVRIGGEGIDPVPLLIDILQDPAHPDAAKAPAAERLGELKDGRARQALIQALGAKSPDRPPSRTRSPQEFFAGRAAAKRNLPAAAARARGRLGDPATIPPLIDAAEQAQGEAKVAMFEALAMLKASQAVRAARQALSDPDQRVRRWAAVLLREVGAKEALPEMQRALVDTDAGVRLQAAMALEQLNDRESVEPIKDALSKETVPEVRQAMEQAVRTLSPP